MKTFRSSACAVLLLCALSSATAQIRQRVPAPDPADGPAGRDFGSKFFDDLRSLFGKLQRSDLDRALQRAQAVHCSDLVEEKGEWKEVAFLNDDRKLGDWHFDTIDQVRQDLVKFVFTGTCRSDRDSVKVTTSYPVTESVERFRQGRIPLSKVVIFDNDPVSVVFDRNSEAYIFDLPYLYRDTSAEVRIRADKIYTLTPPLATSKTDPTVTNEFRCKALSDAELTYRFLLCRTRLMPRGARAEVNERQGSGNAAYYIFSDGKEASSSVKLSFGDAADSNTSQPPPGATRPTAAEPAFAADVKLPAERLWKPAAAQTRLVTVGQGEFRLRFKPETWTARIGKPQILAAQAFSESATSKPAPTQEYCTWKPGSSNAAPHLLEKTGSENFLYSIEFRKQLQSVSSVVFEIQDDAGSLAGNLECFFPQNQTPADVTVGRWVSVVGTNIELDVPASERQ